MSKNSLFENDKILPPPVLDSMNWLTLKEQKLWNNNGSERTLFRQILMYHFDMMNITNIHTF